MTHRIAFLATLLLLAPLVAEAQQTVVAGGPDIAAINSTLDEIKTASEGTRDRLDELPPAYSTQVSVAISTSGNNELIAAVSGQVIDVAGCTLVTRGTVEVQFISGDTGGALANEVNMSGPILLGIAGTNPPGFSTLVPMFVPSGKAFGIELSTGVEVDGYCSYVQHVP